jgi:glycosyltransferase involved in cell wall biosynthesis
MATTLVVPCFNEASRLDTDTFVSFAETTDASFVFVDDGSRDDTFAVLQRMADALPTSITALRLERNHGKAEAVRFGMATAQEGTTDFVGFWDADLATPLSELEALLEHFTGAGRLQMVVGSRILLMGRRIDRKPIRHYVGRVFATVVSLTLGLPIYDTQCGAKVFRNNEITRQLFVDPFVSRWIFDVELIARLMRAVNARDASAVASYLVEHPLMTWTDVPGGKLKLGDFAKSAVDLARIYNRYLR